MVGLVAQGPEHSNDRLCGERGPALHGSSQADSSVENILATGGGRATLPVPGSQRGPHLFWMTYSIKAEVKPHMPEVRPGVLVSGGHGVSRSHVPRPGIATASFLFPKKPTVLCPCETSQRLNIDP